MKPGNWMGIGLAVFLFLVCGFESRAEEKGIVSENEGLKNQIYRQFVLCYPFYSAIVLRDDIWEHHPQIHIVDFDFYSVDVFNRCENTNDILIAIGRWSGVHPLLKVIPVTWGHTILFGLLHSHEPSPTVSLVLEALKKVTGKN